MRYHVVSLLKGISTKTGADITDADMVKWSNDRVHGAGKTSKMDNFKDPTLRNSRFFLDLLSTIRDCVDDSLVTPGETGIHFFYLFLLLSPYRFSPPHSPTLFSSPSPHL
jgi:plastin-1